jgi:Domain of unknown function (DUF6089)
MLKLLKKICFTLILFVLFLPLSKAQFEVGFFAGADNYQGDMAGNTVVWQETQPAFGVLLRYTPNPYLTIRGNFLQGKITGADLHSPTPGQRYRGFSFSSTIREFSFIGEYNFLGQSNEKSYNGGGTLFNPYIYAGLGIVSTDGTPTAPADMRPYPFPEDGAKSILPAIPIGLGVKFQFAETVSVGLEWGTRLTFSDYLDGVSKAGNPSKNDWYMFGGLTLTYCFGYNGY